MYMYLYHLYSALKSYYYTLTKPPITPPPQSASSQPISHFECDIYAEINVKSKQKHRAEISEIKLHVHVSFYS